MTASILIAALAVLQPNGTNDMTGALLDAVKGAKPGDTIRLAEGEYHFDSAQAV